jgi:thioredoxin 2
MAAEIIKCPDCGRRNRVPATASGIPHCGNCHQPLPWIADADDGTFTEVVEKAPLPVLVDFWAPWCGPCRMVSPALEQLATERPGRIKLVKTNVDESPRLQQRFGIQAIPTLMVMRGGQVIARQAGAAPASALRGWLDQALNAPAPPG